MYSRSRTVSAEERYAGNVPPVYGGNRFYRSSAAAAPAEIRTEDIRAAVPTGGIPVQYEAPVKPPPAAEETAEEAEEAAVEICPEEAEIAAGTEMPDPPKEMPAKPSRHLSLFADREEMLLIALLLLLSGEGERAADVIVILLLLLVVR